MGCRHTCRCAKPPTLTSTTSARMQVLLLPLHKIIKLPPFGSLCRAPPPSPPLAHAALRRPFPSTPFKPAPDAAAVPPPPAATAGVPAPGAPSAPKSCRAAGPAPAPAAAAAPSASPCCCWGRGCAAPPFPLPPPPCSCLAAAVAVLRWMASAWSATDCTSLYTSSRRMYSPASSRPSTSAGAGEARVGHGLRVQHTMAARTLWGWVG